MNSNPNTEPTMYQLVFPAAGHTWDRPQWTDVINGAHPTWKQAATRLSDRIYNGEAFHRESVRLPSGAVVLLDDWLFIVQRPGWVGAPLVSTEFWPEWGRGAEPHNADLARVWARAARALSPEVAV